MKKIGIYPNTSKEKAVAVANELVGFVGSLGIGCFIASEKGQLCEADVLVVLGGDGTMLRAARETAMYNIPLLGINIGKLGYLTAMESEDTEKAIKAVVEGDYAIERRMMLQAIVGSQEPLIALNDVYITRGVQNRMFGFEIWINGEYIYTLSADGLIICTPTGSTAYNLSAGGPILKPDAEMIAVTPICPHALHARPMVVSSKDEVVVKINGDGGKIVSADGEPYELLDNERITIKRSQHSALIIKTNKQSFFDVLRHKMIN